MAHRILVAVWGLLRDQVRDSDETGKVWEDSLFESEVCACWSTDRPFWRDRGHFLQSGRGAPVRGHCRPHLQQPARVPPQRHSQVRDGFGRQGTSPTQIELLVRSDLRLFYRHFVDVEVLRRVMLGMSALNLSHDHAKPAWCVCAGFACGRDCVLSCRVLQMRLQMCITMWRIMNSVQLQLTGSLNDVETACWSK